MTERVDRTYGNWIRPATPGLLGFGLLGTGLLFAALTVVLLTALFALPAALVIAGCSALLLAPLLIKDRFGRNLFQVAAGPVLWIGTRRARHRLYRSGPLSRIPAGQCRLPGVAAASRVYDAQDSYGRPFGVVVLPAVGHHTVVLECAADGGALVDDDQIDTWVAHWGQWLAQLAYEPSLAQAAVTIETAPDPGTRLAQEITANLSPDAPGLARQMLGQVAADYPAGSAQVSTRVALTWSAAPRPGGKARAEAEMARQIGARMPGLSHGLAQTGAGAARPMSAARLAEAARLCFDPAAHRILERAGPGESGQVWDNAGPQAAEETPHLYRHDSGISVTWAMGKAPAGEVTARVLSSLVAPHPDIARKRVTLLYRPHSPGESQRIVESDRRAANSRLTGQVADKLADEVAAAAALQSAREHAQGAGVVRFALLVTATVGDQDELSKAESAIDMLAGPTGIDLRRVYYGQAAAFAVATGLFGIVVDEHLKIPAGIREML